MQVGGDDSDDLGERRRRLQSTSRSAHERETLSGATTHERHLFALSTDNMSVTVSLGERGVVVLSIQSKEMRHQPKQPPILLTPLELNVLAHGLGRVAALVERDEERR